MNLLISGGCGYIGTPLTQTLLALGHDVTVIDAQLYGCSLVPHPHLTLRIQDLRRIEQFDMAGFDAVVHLANISDAAVADADPEFTWETNANATTMLVEAAINAGVPHFIHSSAAAVYGDTLDQPRDEASPIVVDSLLTRSLVFAERLLQGYHHDLRVDVIRPGCVCGVSPRMRLDLPVNLYAMQALTRGRITVMGPEQSQSHTHLRDVIRLCVSLLERDGIPAGLYNAAFESCTNLELAVRVATQIPTDIEVMPAFDPRSAVLDSGRLSHFGFKPTYTIDDAIWEIAAEYRMGRLRDEERFYNSASGLLRAVA